MSRVLGSFSWLCRHSTPIPVRGDQVAVLKSPGEFYGTLLEQIRSAKRRIMISSLYIGTGELERNLVKTLDSALKERPEVECNVVLDYLRGTRGSTNSVSLLQDLLSNRQLRLYLYHTPNLRGIFKRIIPQRFNEGVGLQHTKILLFDDNVMLTGANLSLDYFTTRRDRYIIFRNSPNLSDYVAAVLKAICSHSYHALPGRGEGEQWSINGGVDPIQEPATHRQSFEESIINIIHGSSIGSSFQTEKTDSHTDETDTHTDWTDSHTETDSCADTFVFPLLQMGLYNIRQEERVTREILSGSAEGDKLFLASGYFNLPPQYSSAIVNSRGECCVLAASPQANGFYRAKGVAKYVPHMYIQFAKEFLQLVDRTGGRGLAKRIRYYEYEEEGWTYHSKGLWYYRGCDSAPILSLIGSTNYGFRSLTRDLEFQVAIVTGNEQLQQALNDEKNALFEKGRLVSLETALEERERRLSPIVWLTTKLLQRFV